MIKRLTNDNILLYIGLILAVVICALILLFISMPSKRGLKNYWGELNLFQYDILYFFMAKTAAYRRILYFFTSISYGLRILGVLTTFFMIYCLVDKSNFSKALLVLAALCDGINLLFPFQKYVDLFSECCIKMEQCILQSNYRIMSTNDDSDQISQIFEGMYKVYIECENLLHTQNKI